MTTILSVGPSFSKQKSEVLNPKPGENPRFHLVFTLFFRSTLPKRAGFYLVLGSAEWRSGFDLRLARGGLDGGARAVLQKLQDHVVEILGNVSKTSRKGQKDKQKQPKIDTKNCRQKYESHQQTTNHWKDGQVTVPPLAVAMIACARKSLHLDLHCIADAFVMLHTSVLV